MTKLTMEPAKVRTVADLIKRLGDIPPSRIRMDPLPGTATEQDVIEIESREKKRCELVRGVLVEKTMGFLEARIAAVLIHFLESFLDVSDLGIVSGADGGVRLTPELVRIPDVSFVSWKKLPGRELPTEAIPELVPDLAVEILSEGNTPQEMQLKLREYFAVGVRLVWFIDPPTQSAAVYTSRTKKTVLGPAGTLQGGTVLPGFRLPLATLFARAGRVRKRRR